jgi:hypothetical protein
MNMIYGDLFDYTKDENEIHSQYKRLAMKMHPDKGGSNDQFFELKRLYSDALKAVQSKSPYWLSSKRLTFERGIYLDYRWNGKIESSNVFSGDNKIIFIDPDNISDLTSNAKTIIDFFQNRLKSTKSESIRKTVETIPNFTKHEKGNILISPKTSDFHPLSLVVSKYSFRSEDTAWVIGRLMHFMNFFEWLEVMHGAISIENLWIDLDHHRIAILGGWHYSRKYGERLLALPAKSAKFLSGDPIAGPNIDRDCIRETIIELLGGKSIGSLRMNKKIPSQVIDFLSLPFRKSAFETYKDWEEKRDLGFGPRKFMVFPYKLDQLYQK